MFSATICVGMCSNFSVYYLLSQVAMVIGEDTSLLPAVLSQGHSVYLAPVHPVAVMGHSYRLCAFEVAGAELLW